ncbi:hypothetical protein [Microbacterium sp.]|jgi:hypothetical protein|uniref:hypothetical protein n=1 Tax=Microbacterium sp. TaxID=51671 RepID=UPI003C75A8F1
MSAVKPLFRELFQAALKGFSHANLRLHQLTHNIDNHLDDLIRQVKDKDHFDVDTTRTRPTGIDGSVTPAPRQELPPSLAATFTDGEYRTVETTEAVTLYRVYGHSAEQGGAFATTSTSGNRINAAMESALLPEWKNSREFEATIEVPAGQILNIGTVAPQTTMSGAVLPGGADQILLPRDWPSSWVQGVDRLPVGLQGRIP